MQRLFIIQTSIVRTLAAFAAALAIAFFSYSAFDAEEASPLRAFAATNPPTQLAQDAHFVGSAACGTCHTSETQAWKGSHHAHAMLEANADNVQGDFHERQVTFAGVTTTFSQRDGKYSVNTDGPDGQLQDYEVKFTFGFTPLQQYLVELPGGRLQSLPIAWNTRPRDEDGQRWFHLYPGQELRAGDPLHWTGLQQNWNFMCAECHVTNFARNYDADLKTYTSTFSELNVTCESCHGPGSQHLAWAEKKQGWEDLANKGLDITFNERKDVTWSLDQASGNSLRNKPRDSAHEIETCAHCHARRGPIASKVQIGKPLGDAYHVSLLDEDLYFSDGQIKEEVYEYGSFLQSRMNHAGVTCSDCHDPHTSKLRAEGNGVCLQCHAQEKYEATAHTHHAPQSAGTQCAACHMPERTYMVVDNRRDHSLRIPRPDLSVALDTPNACNICHKDKSAQWAADEVKAWFPHANQGFQHYAELFHEGTLGAPGAREKLIAFANDLDQPGIARASALARLDRISSRAMLDQLRARLGDADPLVRRATVEAFASVPETARQDLISMLDDPVLDVRLEAVRQLAGMPRQALDATAQQKLDRGIEEYIASQKSNSDRPEAHHNLALLYLSLHRIEEAETEFRAALDLDPAFVPAVVTLADLYRGTRRDADGEKVLRAFLQREPDAAAVRHALGLLLVRNGRKTEGLDEFKKAAEAAPDNARFAYVYAVALSDSGKRQEAMQVLQNALARHPYNRESLYAMATFLRDAGDRDGAMSYAKRLTALEPDDPGVADFLRSLAR